MDDGHKYLINNNLTPEDLTYYTEDDGLRWVLDIKTLIEAAKIANCEFKKEYEFNKDRPICLLRNVPRKNLSGAVGEALGESYCFLLSGKLGKNPHESGSPDFIPVLEKSRLWFSSPTKDIFYGGFDTKACLTENGQFAKVKPSSHHDQTTTVLIVQWAFKEGIPEIIGIYFTNRLVRCDWKISRKPKKKDSKLTSSATIKASGIHKVREGWVFLRDDVKAPSKNISNTYGLDVLILEKSLQTT